MTSTRDLNQKRNALLKEIERNSGFVRGSITSVCATCNRAGCICPKKSSRRAYRLTYKDSQQKTRIVYIPQSQLNKIRKLIENYKRVRQIIEQLVETNIEAFKKEIRR